MASEPLVGQRRVQVTAHRSKSDGASFTPEIAPRYEKPAPITLVIDNLNTPGPGSLYETFVPGEAQALGDGFEFVYTPPPAGQLAQQGRDRTARIGRSMFATAHRQPRRIGLAGGPLALRPVSCTWPSANTTSTKFGLPRSFQETLHIDGGGVLMPTGYHWVPSVSESNSSERSSGGCV